MKLNLARANFVIPILILGLLTSCGVKNGGKDASNATPAPTPVTVWGATRIGHIQCHSWHARRQMRVGNVRLAGTGTLHLGFLPERTRTGCQRGQYTGEGGS